MDRFCAVEKVRKTAVSCLVPGGRANASGVAGADVECSAHAIPHVVRSPARRSSGARRKPSHEADPIRAGVAPRRGGTTMKESADASRPAAVILIMFLIPGLL